MHLKIHHQNQAKHTEKKMIIENWKGKSREIPSTLLTESRWQYYIKTHTRLVFRYLKTRQCSDSGSGKRRKKLTEDHQLIRRWIIWNWINRSRKSNLHVSIILPITLHGNCWERGKWRRWELEGTGKWKK